MKSPFKLLAFTGAAALLLTSPGLQAESTYGYNAAGTGTVSASAKVNVTVTVPKLILLRVGASGGTADTATVALAPTSTGIPGGVTSLAAGNSQASGWDGTAPGMEVTSTTAAVNARTLTATAWTNAAGGGSLTGAVTTAFDATSGLTAAHVSVTSAAGTLAHPGTNTGTFTPTTFNPNTVVSSTWEYSLTAAGLSAARAGSHTQVVTYTASSV